MFFLVFFQFGTLQVHHIDLSVQVFLDRVVFLCLFVQRLQPLGYSLFLLFCADFSIGQTTVSFHHFLFVLRFQLYKTFLGFE